MKLKASQNRWVYFLYGAWAFDYRAESGDQLGIVIQTIALIFTLGTFVLLILRGDWRVSNAVKIVSMIFVVFALESSIVGIDNGQTVYEVSVLALPLILLCVYAFYAYDAFARTVNPIGLMSALSRILMVSIIARFLISTMVQRFDLEDVRYQILSSASIPAGSLMVTGLISYLSVQDMLLASANMLAIYYSVTRTNVGVIVGMATAVGLFSPRALIRSAFINRIVVILAVLIVISIAREWGTGSDIGSRWSGRLSQADEIGFDITRATRQAEIDAQMEALSSSIAAKGFGFGIAARNKLSGLYAQMILETSAFRAEADTVNIGYGHNIYAGLLYTGGFIFGGAAICAILFLNIYACRTIRDLGRYVNSDIFARPAIWSSLCIIGFSLAGFLGGILGDRGYSLWLGTAVGVMFACSKRSANTRAASTGRILQTSAVN